MNRTVLFPLTLAVLALPGCMANRYQISNALERYGLNENEASCAAEFLRGHLTTGQVNRLARAAHDFGGDRRLTVGDLVRVAGSVEDSEVLLQTGAAMLACKVAADIPIGGF